MFTNSGEQSHGMPPPLPACIPICQIWFPVEMNSDTAQGFLDDNNELLIKIDVLWSLQLSLTPAHPPVMSVSSLYLINKHGSLLYQLDVSPSKVSANDKIRIASIFHSVSAIAGRISPNREPETGDLSFLQPKGIERIKSKNFTIHSKETITGLNILIIAHPTMPAKTAGDVLRLVYESYANYVMKDPFYSLDMPIRSHLFDSAVKQILGFS